MWEAISTQNLDDFFKGYFDTSHTSNKDKEQNINSSRKSCNVYVQKPLLHSMLFTLLLPLTCKC